MNQCGKNQTYMISTAGPFVPVREYSVPVAIDYRYPCASNASGSIHHSQSIAATSSAVLQQKLMKAKVRCLQVVWRMGRMKRSRRCKACGSVHRRHAGSNTPSLGMWVLSQMYITVISRLQMMTIGDAISAGRSRRSGILTFTF